MKTYLGNPKNLKLKNFRKVAQLSSNFSLYEADNHPTGITVFKDKETYIKFKDSK